MARPTPDSRPAPSRLRSPSEVFREAIERAVGEGAERDEMLLQLTLSDASSLKRDRSLAVSDISFSDGVMRFLGVKVRPGDVTVSRLERSGASVEA